MKCDKVLNEIRYDMKGYMKWYETIWYDMKEYTKYDMKRVTILKDIWNDMIWQEMIWFGMKYDMKGYMKWYKIIWNDTKWYDMIYLLTAIGFPPGVSGR